MPEMDGLEVTAAIRAQESAPPLNSTDPAKHAFATRVPIVALTAHASEGDRDRCLAAGMDDYLSKPIRPRQLRETLQRVATSAGASCSPESSPVVSQTETSSNLTNSGTVLLGTSAAEHEQHLVDWPAALEAVDGDRRLLAELIDIFNVELPGWEARIDRALESSDASALRLAAHTLKGALASLGARRASRRSGARNAGRRRESAVGGKRLAHRPARIGQFAHRAQPLRTPHDRRVKTGAQRAFGAMAKPRDDYPWAFHAIGNPGAN